MRILQHIPKIITEEDNDFLITAPTQEEVKEVVFSMDPNSTSGSDGFNRFFFQKFWDIIKDDITDKVKELINGEQMPKFFTRKIASLNLVMEQLNEYEKGCPIYAGRKRVHYFTDIDTKIVRKITSDGCSKGNPGLNAGGGIIQNHNDELLAAYAVRFGIITNNMAESLALKDGLDWCIEKGYKNIIVEMTLCCWLTGCLEKLKFHGS
ncbi:uncharacterized protein LOC142175814 [Nicotiana tabacum]|uniref:Uncharacterized protein LOC142175814 n=1 Tax=Nicotiana tabacum TaxID=4097 RepID=A0AC58TNV4_TOBAC